MAHLEAEMRHKWKVKTMVTCAVCCSTLAAFLPGDLMHIVVQMNLGANLLWIWAE